MNQKQLRFFRYISGTAITLQLEPAQPMDCTVRDIFETNFTSTLDNKVLPSLNGTFELSSKDISLVSNLIGRKYILQGYSFIILI